MHRETITLTQQEQQRVHLLTQVQHGTLQAGAAAQLLGLSLRHVPRLLARVRQQGLPRRHRGVPGQRQRREYAHQSPLGGL
jgi:CRP-like cAMP-binding protein